MSSDMGSFGSAARDLSKNPLGIIALFIVLVYGFACLLFGFSTKTLPTEQQWLLVGFVVFFPLIVLMLFGWLVSKHHDKLYGPSDYRDDTAFLEISSRAKIQVQAQQKATKLEFTSSIHDKSADVRDLLAYGEQFSSSVESATESIIVDLKKRTLNYDSVTEKVLIRQLAVARVLIWFEQVYRVIFGSQISLLLELKEKSEGELYEKIKKVFDDNKKSSNNLFADWDFSQYIKYLITQELILVKDGGVFITPRGIDFLKILELSNYTTDKSL
ncbi:TPA: histidine kinase [Yersinia enterocolitica]|nr:histidine kinase [Yersinia enterocolitica]HDL7490261.1 histidine kinase [Yersinia enterocolitica]HDL7493648.1 histidine kinase [Yersinia enterocolitica]